MNTLTLIEELKSSLPSMRMLHVVAVGAVEVGNRLIILKNRFTEISSFSKDQFETLSSWNESYEDLHGKMVIFDHSLLNMRGKRAIKEWMDTK